MMRIAATLVAGVLVVAGTLGAEDPNGTDVNYRQQIQPLLAQHCYACHGPDEAARTAGLRLDDESVAKESVIVPGDTDASELISRIFSDDPETMMPPADARHPLSIDEKNLLKRWIAQGAIWQRHWAFEPIAANDTAKSSTSQSIDGLIQERLKSEGLSPSPRANKAKLLRRVSIDLVGLPPTPAQLAEFQRDRDPGAFERVVDRLLDAPQYGEQMAVEWLDVARYADTNGYQNDFVRNMWPWRDWVIEAFNQNLPYDQFIIHQIAGDMLPDPTRDQLIASGFNRNNPSVTEGGSIEEEWRIENAIDRVETTSAAFLGLTMGCARCHDHKYDPVSQTEFYEFFAFFNNVDEKGVYNEARGNVGPQLEVPTAEQTTQLDQWTAQINELQRRVELESSRDDSSQLIEQWRAGFDAAATMSLPQPVFVFNQRDANGLPEGQSPVGASLKFPGSADAANPIDSPTFTFANDAPFAWTAWIQGDSRGAIFGQMDDGNDYRGVDGLILDDGRLKVHLIHQWPSDALAVISRQSLTAGQWNFVTVTYDGKGKADGTRIYFNGNAMEVEAEPDNLRGSFTPDVPLKIGQRSASSYLKGELSEFRLYDRALSETEIQSLLHRAVIFHHDQMAETVHAEAGLDVIRQYLGEVHQSEYKMRLKALQALRDQLMSKLTTTMIMKERAGTGYRETFRLERGQYDKPDRRVALMPSVPAALPPLDDEPKNRLGLARWMVDTRNPLVARVAVNRAWLKFFGRGLVSSVGNFGLQGEPPSHPELLDQLAADFRDSGWDLKRLHKRIVMSTTYQQSSDLSESAAVNDPENRWLARGPRYRMSAEQIRDSALQTAGLLVTHIGGPSVFPYQPAGLWDELAGGANNGPYVQSQGEDLYRRSLYTYRKRTVSHPTTATFDAPNWDICQLKRARTNTPLQSLALLNDITYVEASRKLAERMLSEGDIDSESTEGVSTDDAIRRGFMLTTSREPDENERDVLRRGYQSYLEFYGEHPDAAAKLLSTGDAAVSAGFPHVRLAAMTSVAAVLLNLDEAITKE